MEVTISLALNTRFNIGLIHTMYLAYDSTVTILDN